MAYFDHSTTLFFLNEGLNLNEMEMGTIRQYVKPVRVVQVGTTFRREYLFRDLIAFYYDCIR